MLFGFKPLSRAAAGWTGRNLESVLRENGLTLIFVQSRHGWGAISDENAQRSTRRNRFHSVECASTKSSRRAEVIDKRGTSRCDGMCLAPRAPVHASLGQRPRKKFP